MVEIGSTALDVGPVAHHRIGGDDDAGPSPVRAPAKVDVVTVEARPAIESSEGPEQIGTHEEAGA